MANDAAVLRHLAAELNNPLITGAQVPQEEAEAMQKVLAPPVPVKPVPPKPAGPARFVTMAEVPQPAQRKFLFTGLPKSGKSHLAQLMGAITVELDDPIIRLGRAAFGEAFSGDEHTAQFVAIIRAWGDGVVSDQVPLTPERAMFLDNIRTTGADGKKLFQEDPAGFGSPGFWAASLIARAERILEKNPGKQVVTTAIYSSEQYSALRANGFRPYHVMCSTATLTARGAGNLTVNNISSRIEQDVIKKISEQPSGSGLWCVWTDQETPRPSPRILNIDDFLRLTK